MPRVIGMRWGRKSIGSSLLPAARAELLLDLRDMAVAVHAVGA